MWTDAQENSKKGFGGLLGVKIPLNLSFKTPPMTENDSGT